MGIVIVAHCLFCSTAAAYPNGITGLYQNGCGGGTCHGGNANANTVLSLTGSTSVYTNSATEYTFRVANAGQNAAGFNLAILSGAGAKSAAFTPGNGIQMLNNELTHTNAQAFAAGGANFTFTWTSPAAHGVYTLYAAGNAVNNNGNSAGDVWNLYSTQITVKGATITNPTGATAFCVGESLNITWTQTGLGNIRIELSSDNFANTTVVNNSIAANTGQYSYTFPTSLPSASTYMIRLVEVSTGTELARTLGFTVSGMPVITTQPTNQTVCEGRAFQLICGATGKDPVYQWRKGGTNIPGAVQGVYSVPNAVEQDAGEYDCVVTSCSQSVTSQKVTVTLQQRPKITQSTVGPIDTCEGANITLNVTATGDGLTYEWSKNGVIIPGENSASLVLNGITELSDGDYRCRVVGVCTPPDTTPIIKINVLEKPTITTHPSDVTITVGQTLTLTVNATGEQLSYQWLRNGVPIPGATEKMFTKISAVRSDSGSYTCVVSNKCTEVTSGSARVTVNPTSGPGVVGVSTDSIDFGNIGLCTGADSVVQGLVLNEGGTPITVTAIATTPQASIQIVHPDLPFVIEPGQSQAVTIRLAPQQVGQLSGTVVFTSTGGEASTSIVATIVSDLVPETDTLTFAQGVIDHTLYARMLPLQCEQASVTSIQLIGAGASSFSLRSHPTTPFTIVKNDVLEVGIATASESGEEAILAIASTAGTAQVVLRRGDVSSVQEYTGIPGMTVAPNPMTEELFITVPGDGIAHVRVYSTLGTEITALRGRGAIRWDARDASGRRVAQGVYVFVIEHAGSSALVKVLVQ